MIALMSVRASGAGSIVDSTLVDGAVASAAVLAGGIVVGTVPGSVMVTGIDVEGGLIEVGRVVEADGAVPSSDDEQPGMANTRHPLHAIDRRRARTAVRRRRPMLRRCLRCRQCYQGRRSWGWKPRPASERYDGGDLRPCGGPTSQGDDELVVPLARRNLFTEKIRFAMSTAGVAFAVLLVLVVTSLYRGWSESSAFFSDLPGDMWVAQEGTSDPLRSSSFLPADRRDDLQHIDGVAVAMPVYTRRIAISTENRELSAQFMAFAAPTALPVSDEDRARYLPSPGAVIVDSVFAADVGVTEGGVLNVLDRRLLVEHIEPGGNPLFALVFVNGDDAPDLLGLEGYVSFFALVTEPGTSLDSLAVDVAATMPGAEARTSAEYAETMSATVDEGFLPVVAALVGIGLAIGGAVVALTTYTATIEKARDYAVMKALGASGWFVYRVVIRQSAIVGVAGSVLGVVAAALVATFVRRVVPEFVTDMQWPDAVFVAAATIVVSLVAAYVPVRRINSIDPAMVFRA